ncbi:hypothetical protein BC830DRAFT_1138183 [Chytriomyces sp. MP71]|nr:hypothetical protein BC830DRAFT_1138183 [Chytriomyces sp. MP71]
MGNTHSIVGSEVITAASALENEARTLQDMLEPYSVHGSLYETRFGPNDALIYRMQGTLQGAYHTYAIWPAVGEGLIMIQRLMFAKYGDITIPFCQTNLMLTLYIDDSSIPESLTKTAALVSSLVAQCAYCSSTLCGLGDAFNGHIAITKPINLDTSQVSDNDRHLLRLSVASTKLPARVTSQMRSDVINVFGAGSVEKIALALAFGAYSNTLNVILGAELDEHFSKRAETGFKNFPGFRFGPHKFKSRAFKPLISRYVNASPLVFVNLFFQWRQSEKMLEESLTGSPTSDAELNDMIRSLFGFLPRYLAKISNGISKRRLTTMLRRLIFWDDNAPELSLSTQPVVAILSLKDRLVLSFVYMMAASNGLLAAHFGYTAARHGVKPSELEYAWATATNFSTEFLERITDPLDFMILLTYAVARRLHKRTYAMSPSLFNICGGNPATTMCLTGLLSTLACIHRFSVIVDDCFGFEREVAVFAASTSYGIANVLGSLPSASNSNNFDPSAEELEMFWYEASEGVEKEKHVRSNLESVIGSHDPTFGGSGVWGGRVQY